ncbi:hypothetical protein ACLGIH_02995 [Streptomyces sp. HMX87]|uniref:hypothetical protein n=1 Tax=Streptomyces sp. HMX87 TaxID=3390849 RepID=UPI003A873437
MTVPEENRRKTESTDDVVQDPHANPSRTREEARAREDAEHSQGATGRTMREALEEAQVRPDDYDEK